MLISKTTILDVDTFEVGDIIDITLTDGEEAQALAVRQDADGMVFLFVDCLRKEYPMNRKNSNHGGYAASNLRSNLNGEILDRFSAELRAKMVAFENGDFLRLPTEKEIFGENSYGKNEPEDVVQFESMKNRRNRIAFQGKNGGWEWYWLQNEVENSGTNFAGVGSAGYADYGNASSSVGVRPAFKI